MGSVPRVDWTKVDHVLLDMDGTLLDLAFDNDFWGHQIHAHYAALNKLSYDAVVHKFEPLFRSVEGTPFEAGQVVTDRGAIGALAFPP